ncbi:MAG: hypothetical protein JWN48_4973 [Myxococcaceae bacterium]|nr:hypothetical protein [Myxococcaceae bacterium]
MQTGETAPAPEPPLTTWAVRIAPGSRCAENHAFANTVSAQIPSANRAAEEDAELVAEVKLEESGLAHVLVFDRVLQAEAGSRELQLNSRSCDDSAEAVALVLAVLVEAGRGALRAAPPPVAVEPPPLPAPPPPPPPPPPAPRRAEVRHPWLGPRAGHDLNAAVGLSFGLLPTPTLAATVGWGIRGTKLWPIWLELNAMRKGTDGEVGVHLGAVYASVLGCPLSGARDRFYGRVCAGAGLGALWARSFGLPTNESKTNVLYVLGVEGAGNVRLVGPLEFTAMFRGDVYPERYSFYPRGSNGRTWLYRSKPVSATLLAGLALRFR